MIPYISTNVTNAALYSLSDVISCEVAKSEAGECTLKMSYPVGGAYADMLVLYNHIRCISSRVDTVPLIFVISKIEQNINGVLSITANHITYELAGYPVKAFDKASRTPQEAAAALHANAVRDPAGDGLSVTADESTDAKEFGFDRPTTMREAVFGSGGLLDVYGGYAIVASRFIKWYSKDSVGGNKGYIRYGVNLIKWKRIFDVSDTYTHAYVYWKNGDELVQASGLVQLGGTSDFIAATVLDLSDEFESAPTTAQLTAKAQELAAQRELTTPEVSLDISFVPLRLTDEYKDMTWLEEVDLYDIVTVEVPMFGTHTRARVVKTQFDVLSESYKRISIGNLQRSLDRTIARLI